MRNYTVVRFGMLLLAVASLPASQPRADWPQWGGSRRDFAVERENTLEAWPDTGPPVLWRRELGAGFSAIVVAGDRLFTMYRRDDREFLVAASIDSGKTLWERSYPAAVPSDHPHLDTSYGAGPNSTPASRRWSCAWSPSKSASCTVSWIFPPGRVAAAVPTPPSSSLTGATATAAALGPCRSAAVWPSAT